MRHKFTCLSMRRLPRWLKRLCAQWAHLGVFKSSLRLDHPPTQLSLRLWCRLSTCGKLDVEDLNLCSRATPPVGPGASSSGSCTKCVPRHPSIRRDGSHLPNLPLAAAPGAVHHCFAAGAVAGGVVCGTTPLLLAEIKHKEFVFYTVL